MNLKDELLMSAQVKNHRINDSVIQALWFSHITQVESAQP